MLMSDLFLTFVTVPLNLWETEPLLVSLTLKLTVGGLHGVYTTILSVSLS